MSPRGKLCPDGCGQTVHWEQADGQKPRLLDNRTGEPHWLVCESPKARRMRVRAGREAGVFPVSVTRIKLYRSCPQAYRRRYIDGVLQPETTAMAVGKAFHLYVAQRLNGEQPALPLIPAELSADWRLLVDAFERQSWESPHLAGIERTLPLTWQDEAMTVAMEAVIDMLWIDGSEATVTDWKTSHSIPSKSALLEDLQLRVYALSVLRNYPQVSRVRAQQVLFRYGGHVASVEFTADDLEEFEPLLKAEVGRILRDADFVPNPWCETCPPDAHELATPSLLRLGGGGEISLRPPQSSEEAENLAQLGHACRRLEEAVKDNLRDWTAAENPVGGYGHWPQTSRSITDIRRAIELLESKGYGRELKRFVRLDMTAAKPLLGDGRRAIPELRELIHEEVTTKFMFKRVSAEETVEAQPVAAPT